MYTTIHIQQLSFLQFFMGKQRGSVPDVRRRQNQGKIAHKRIKLQEIMEKGDDDGISALPDCLLLEILSRLPSTKDAIRTGTLSKRWEHLWTWVPTLIFSTTNRPPTQRLQNSKSRADFALLVDKTLSKCRQIKLKKFKVHTYYDTRFESQFNNWIHYVISCNVEELNLDFWGRETEFLLNQFIFINSCFTDLRLAGCKLNPTGAISWENLRSLCISGVNVDEDLIVNIVSGSPLLETLVFEYCRWPNITSESESESEAGDIIEKCVPTSLSLTQCRQLKLIKKFKVGTSYDIQFQSQINSCIRYVIRCNVQELNLRFWNHDYDYEFVLDQIVYTSSCFTELRVGGCMLNPVGAISWKSLRSLCISEYMSLDDLIENILSGSPILETLELDDCYGFRRLNITSKSVKNLVLCGYEVPFGGSEADMIEINAPNILSLTIQGWIFFLCKPLLLNVSSLVKAHLNYNCTKLEHCETMPNEVEEEVLKGCIMNIRHVKELQLGVLCSKVLSCLQAKGFVSPSNVKLAGGLR